MKSKRRKAILFICTLLCIASCDSVQPRDTDNSSARISSLSVDPSNVQFLPADGDKDTTIVISVDTQVLNSITSPTLSVTNKLTNSEIINTPMNRITETEFQYDFSIDTRTTSVSDYKIIILLDNGIYAQSDISIEGFANQAPEILFVQNPNEVTIPSGSNTETVSFTAKVTDADGQESIQNVFLNFRNSDGSLLTDDPFEMLDNGDIAVGDQVAADSVYTFSFTIDSSNTPNERTALYWSVDRSGLSSDTVRSTFNIVQ